MRYDAAAWGVMIQLGIPINDLHDFALPRLVEIRQPANVHFIAAGSRMLAERVVEGVLFVAGRQLAARRIITIIGLSALPAAGIWLRCTGGC